ncbi:MAG TPA: c-type cytochrome [Casimicrobiaceae bacterium]|nr:c-type cytochrome [Casimicrobiaceae bacterium]
MTRVSLLVAVAAIVLSAGAVAQSPAPAPAQTVTGDAAAGAQKIEMCIGCHGIVGWRTAFPEVYRVPKIGGQHAAYIMSALKEYRAGQRSHPSMKAIAATLSDKDIADLAAYYSTALARSASK